MDLSFRYYKTTPLIITTLVLASVLDWLISKILYPFLSTHDIHILRAPSNAALIGMFLYFYDKNLWKLIPLLITIPNMNGRYKGKIYFSRNNERMEKECVIEIYQTASSIKMHSYFNNEQNERTSSKSLVESIEYGTDGFYHIHIFYLNEGSNDRILDCHQGANSLKFIKKGDKKMLIGSYFTNRQIQTRGEMELEFVSKELQGKL